MVDCLKGVMFNGYPDSIGKSLSDSVRMLSHPELRGAFSLFYILPTFFHSDLDRGFSIIDYDVNEALVSKEDLTSLKELGILLKFDLVLNHLSVGSPQFQDLLQHGDRSEFKDFFIDWNDFWMGNGEMGDEGYVVPVAQHLQKLFMRKPGLPILKVRFPDGTERPYWNTFYQQVDYHPISLKDLANLDGLSPQQAEIIVTKVNTAIEQKRDFRTLELGVAPTLQQQLIEVVEQKRTYLGQMDLNARSEKVWRFYEDTFRKLKSYGATLIRLDAFAYLHKEPGKTNFFNKPETWHYLARLRELAAKFDLVLLPEIHCEYGVCLHEEVSGEGYPIYDFFFPGLVIDAIDRGTSRALRKWIAEVQTRNIKTITMLGCHDGIPVLDLKSRGQGTTEEKSLLSDEEIDGIVERILARGGRVKNLYGPDGKKIAYYQVNATFFSALGEDERKLLLARALHMFMPGIPQVWYLDLFAGKNDYEAADRGGAAGHKEINRTTLTMQDIEEGLAKPVVKQQIELIKIRNGHSAFAGSLEVRAPEDHMLEFHWQNGADQASLQADLKSHSFNITLRSASGDSRTLTFP